MQIELFFNDKDKKVLTHFMRIGRKTHHYNFSQKNQVFVPVLSRHLRNKFAKLIYDLE
jgi:hypothetical protein